jgi:hypothetical protein
MKLGDAIEQLMRVATRIPGGVEAEVHIWVCDGSSILTTTDFEIDHAATINTVTSKASEYFGIIKAHPHRDPSSRTHRAATEDADEYLRQWSEEDSG